MTANTSHIYVKWINALADVTYIGSAGRAQVTNMMHVI